MHLLQLLLQALIYCPQTLQLPRILDPDRQLRRHHLLDPNARLLQHAPTLPIIRLEHRNLLSELRDQSGLWVAIDDRFVFYVHGSGGVAQGARALFVVRLGGAHARDHVCV